MSKCPAARYTVEFVRSVLPIGAKRLLEIGCGEGQVAELLQAVGYEVIALDVDDEAVRKARARGVDARLSQWPEPQCVGLDAVLFTRSLHHIRNLRESVRAAFGALQGAGAVIVEDFGYNEAPEATLGWFRSLASFIVAIQSGKPSPFVAALLATRGELGARWMAEHDHELHSASAIAAALAEHSDSVTSARAAYYFRYLESMFEDDPAGLEALIEHEEQLVGLGLIAPLGRRFVAIARG